ncbi:MAG: histidine kinase dimerization/phospho-acceptor domain-containing protein [Candidatus Thermoplasmatota archaeon]|jgi:signal transduction histidine kinase
MDGENRKATAAALDATMRRALPAIFFGVGTLYLVVALVTPILSLNARPSAGLVARWIGTAAIGLLGALVLRRRPAPAGWGNAIAGLLGLLAVANSLFLIREAGPAFLFAMIVALVGFSLFLLSLAWIIGLSGVATAGWLYLAQQAGWAPIWSRGTINLLAFCTVAMVAQAMRIALHRRLELLKLRDLQRIAQENELTREKALGEQRRRIVRMTAHELATPLTPVLLQSHLLAQSDLSPQQRETLAVLQRNLDRLHATIKKVVAAAQADEETVDGHDPGDLDG